MKAFFLTLAHAAVGGFASYYVGHAVGHTAQGALLAASGGSALTSVLSLFCQSPAKSVDQTQQ